VNLHQIASGAIAAVNPFVRCQLIKNQKYQTNPDGSTIPIGLPPVFIPCQIQALEYNDIAQLDGMNIQGERRAIYLNGDWEGVVRVSQDGGDSLMMPDGTVWLAVFTFENWPDWTKLAVTLQNGS
jgi:hypothetical protein